MRTLWMVLAAVAAVGCAGDADPGDAPDETPPGITISSPPAEGAITREASASFTITSDEPATICWTLDDGAPACSAAGVSSFEAVLPELSSGAHTLAATASDEAGNTGGAARHWTVDPAAPAIGIESSVAEGAVTAATSATFTIGTDEPATICWSLDGGDPACSAAGVSSLEVTLPVVASGEHVLAVTVTDAAGNTATAARHWTVDTAAPAITISAPPAEGESVATTGATFTLTASEPATICWNLDGRASTCSAAGATSLSFALAELPEGDHTLAVTATDRAGNAASAARRWTVDTRAPAITISAPPAEGATVAVAGADFAVSTSEAATICWRLDGGAPSCSAPEVRSLSFALDLLLDGNHALTVTATDRAGNAATAARHWKVDTRAPAVTIGGPPAEATITDETRATFTISTSEPATICWSLDGGASTCSAAGVTSFAAALVGLPDGYRTFSVAAIDVAGNAGSATRHWIVDTRAPAIAISAPPADGDRTDAVDVTFTLATDEPATICWGLDGGSPICSAPGVTIFSAALQNLSQGNHQLAVTATDRAGNGSTATRVWTVALTAPGT